MYSVSIVLGFWKNLYACHGVGINDYQILSYVYTPVNTFLILT